MNIRSMASLVLVSALLYGGAVFNALPAYLSDETEAPAPRQIMPPEPRPRPWPPPAADNPLSRLIRRIEIGRSYAYGRLAVFPLEIRDPGDLTNIRSLDEALNRGWIRIREQEQARVSEIVVRNESSNPVFLMAGEIIGGGRQDRIVRSDVLVQPGWDAVTVPVYCGEKERWKGADDTFDRAPNIAGQAMRSMAAREASQDAIWSEIDRKLNQAGVPAPTRSYQSLYSDEAARRRIDGWVDRFHDIRTRRTVGLVIVDRGRVVSVDLFGDPGLCSALWDKIIRSHAADFVREDDWRRSAEAPADAYGGTVRRFLDDLSTADLRREHTPGAGEAFAIRGRADGRALVWNGGLVHAAAFP